MLSHLGEAVGNASICLAKRGLSEAHGLLNTAGSFLGEEGNAELLSCAMASNTLCITWHTHGTGMACPRGQAAETKQGRAALRIPQPGSRRGITASFSTAANTPGAPAAQAPACLPSILFKQAQSQT